MKILFQSSNPNYVKYTGSFKGLYRAISHIYSTGGVQGLFQGHSATLVRMFPYAAIKFVAYEQYKHILMPRIKDETPIRKFAAGSLAGTTTVLVTYPLELIRVRLAYETKNDGRPRIFKLCKVIFNERSSEIASHSSGTLGVFHSISNFYRGFLPTIVGMFPYAGVSFMVHDIIGDALRVDALKEYTLVSTDGHNVNLDSEKRPLLKFWAEMASGGLAGMVAQTSSYPLEVIRRRMQVGGAVGKGAHIKFISVVKDIMQKSGFRGFFVGLSIGFIKMVPMSATSFFVYERMKALLGI